MKNDINQQLREESGSINDNRKVVTFLYELMRDHITPGLVEELVRKVNLNGEEVEFSNGWLAQYAQHLADRLDD